MYNFILVSLLIYLIKADSAGNFNITDFKSGPSHFIYRKIFDCSDHPTPINLTIVPRWLNSTYQVLDGYLRTPIPMGNNLLAEAATYMSVQNNWVHIANTSAKFCHFMSIYLGPLRKVTYGCLGLPANTCPIPPGTYRPKNVHFDMVDSRVPIFPLGHFKIYWTLRNIPENVLQLCMGLLIEN